MIENFDSIIYIDKQCKDYDNMLYYNILLCAHTLMSKELPIVLDVI
jgi:hypothetical protein